MKEVHIPAHGPFPGAPFKPDFDIGYTSLLSHLNHHNLKDWLLDGCRREDANTIKAAVHRTSSKRLREALARVLSEPDK